MWRQWWGCTQRICIEKESPLLGKRISVPRFFLPSPRKFCVKFYSFPRRREEEKKKKKIIERGRVFRKKESPCTYYLNIRREARILILRILKKKKRLKIRGCLNLIEINCAWIFFFFFIKNLYLEKYNRWVFFDGMLGINNRGDWLVLSDLHSAFSGYVRTLERAFEAFFSARHWLIRSEKSTIGEIFITAKQNLSLNTFAFRFKHVSLYITCYECSICKKRNFLPFSFFLNEDQNKNFGPIVFSSNFFVQNQYIYIWYKI